MAGLSGFMRGLMLSALLLMMCAGLYTAMLCAVQRAPRLYTALCLFPALLCFCLLCLLLCGMDGVTGAPVRAAMRMPLPAMCLLLALCAGWSGFAALRLRAWRRTHVCAASMREGLDCLPAGLCFYESGGLPRLVNARMDALCCALTGAPLMNGERFFAQLAAGDVPGDCQALETGDTPLVRVPDGGVWSFERRAIEVDGRQVMQLIATDVTREHAMNARLQEENRRLMQMNRRLWRYGGRIRELTRERETLAAKVRIHDDFGQALLSARRLNASHGGEAQRAQVLAMWRTSLALLRESGAGRPGAQGLAALAQAARAVGVTVSLEGIQPPADAPCAALLENAVHECLTNTVRHAGGSALHVRLTQESGLLRAVMTNDGEPPRGEITEGGGLSSLRRRIEGAGGRMRVHSAPRFALELELPTESEEWP